MDNMTNNELLLAMSDLMRAQLKAELEPIRQDINTIRQEVSTIKQDIKAVEQEVHNINLRLENKIEPQIQLLAENYVPSAKRYEKATAQIDAMQADIDIMKSVIAEHSEKLKKIS